MTAGLDQRWRSATLDETVRKGDRCSTPAAALATSRSGARARGAEAVGLDFSARMLEARRKEPAIDWVQGDVLALQFEDASFDAATVGFGVRNVENLEAGLRELHRAARGRPAGHSRDYDAARPACTVPCVVRQGRAGARQGGSRRIRLHVSARACAGLAAA
jgi:ubiquinone/menaquinone biosynthesis C-methylase UbiE